MTLLQDQIHHSFSVLFDHMDQSHQRCIISHSEHILLCEYKIRLYIGNLIIIFKYWISQKKSNFTCITTVSSQFWNRSPVIYAWIIHLSTAQVVWVAVRPTYHIELALHQKWEIRISAILKYEEQLNTDYFFLQHSALTMSTAIWNRALGVLMGARKDQWSVCGS